MEAQFSSVDLVDRSSPCIISVDFSTWSLIGSHLQVSIISSSPSRFLVQFSLPNSFFSHLISFKNSSFSFLFLAENRGHGKGGQQRRGGGTAWISGQRTALARSSSYDGFAGNRAASRGERDEMRAVNSSGKELHTVMPCFLGRGLSEGGRSVGLGRVVRRRLGWDGDGN